ncbi:hypothetical protein BY458DRAFT_552866 [Sporodiniella umbellata]|nr:hypothetical protein BY458DRAFT_552866 [Sporodiniella umbellata]
MPAEVTDFKIKEITQVLKEQVCDTPENRFLPRHIDLNPTKAPDSSSANVISIKKENVELSTLSPREQEKQNETALKGMDFLLNNEFMAAKAIFEEKANADPLNALALSSMAFLKAIMTSTEQDYTAALEALNTTYDIALAQINGFKGPSKVTSYFSGYYNFFKGSNDSPTAHSESRISASYIPNSVLRAHVIKAECSLQIAVIHLLYESVVGYLKCGLNLKRAYNSYSYVWQEYQKMGADYLAFIDADTLSCLQFGIGAVQLILSLLPAKVMNAIYSFGWKPDRELGFSLLNQCIKENRIRSSMATIVLLIYYSTAISFAPLVLSDTYKKAAMKTLLETQQAHPNSTIYLYFAGLMARLGFDLPLSTQSFLYTAEFSRGEWAQIALTNTCRFEIGINHMITGNWEKAATTFNYLYDQKYGSAAFCRYLEGACYEMMGERAKAVVLFAEVPQLVTKKLGGRLSDVDAYVLRKTALFQKSGYQNIDFFVPALEVLCLKNLLFYQSHELLRASLKRIDHGLTAIQKCMDIELEERMKEILVESDFPDYYNELASLYVVKGTILNILGLPEEASLDLNWILDHEDYILDDTWAIPFGLWEIGVSCWKMGIKEKSQQAWKRAVDYSQYNFELRLAVRLTLALTQTD